MRSGRPTLKDKSRISDQVRRLEIDSINVENESVGVVLEPHVKV